MSKDAKENTDVILQILKLVTAIAEGSDDIGEESLYSKQTC